MRRYNWGLISVWIGVYAFGIFSWWAFFKLAAYLIRLAIGG